MRFISWNVNGLRACMQKGFAEYFAALNADFFCLQETKLQPEQISIDFPGYSQFWNSAEKGLFRHGRLHKARTAFRHLRRGR